MNKDCPFCESPEVEPFSDMDPETGVFAVNCYIKCKECGGRGPDIDITTIPKPEPVPFIIRQVWDAWNRRSEGMP